MYLVVLRSVKLSCSTLDMTNVIWIVQECNERVGCPEHFGNICVAVFYNICVAVNYLELVPL